MIGMSKKTVKMTLSQYRGRLGEYSSEYLQCKDVRHRWVVTEDYTPEGNGWVVRSLECDRCGTIRTDKYAVLRKNRLARAGSTYRYPEGYRFNGLPDADHLSEVTRYEAYLRAIKNGHK